MPTLVNRGMVMMPPKLGRPRSTSAGPPAPSQLHLHHCGAAGAANLTEILTGPATANVRANPAGACVAVSWAASAGDTCGPVLTWGPGTAANHTVSATATGVTRAYPKGLLGDASPAVFHHVLLTGLIPGVTYFYSVGCPGNQAATSPSFTAPRSAAPRSTRPRPEVGYSFAIFGDMVSRRRHPVYVLGLTRHVFGLRNHQVGPFVNVALPP